MNIDFKTLRKSRIDYDVLLDIFETMYNELKENSGDFTKIIFNEYIDVLQQQDDVQNGWKFELKESPTSMSDIKITTDSGKIITPTAINKLDGNIVGIISTNINENSVLFVDYKY